MRWVFRGRSTTNHEIRIARRLRVETHEAVSGEFVEQRRGAHLQAILDIDGELDVLEGAAREPDTSAVIVRLQEVVMHAPEEPCSSANRRIIDAHVTRNLAAQPQEHIAGSVSRVSGVDVLLCGLLPPRHRGHELLVVGPTVTSMLRPFRFHTSCTPPSESGTTVGGAERGSRTEPRNVASSPVECRRDGRRPCPPGVRTDRRRMNTGLNQFDDVTRGGNVIRRAGLPISATLPVSAGRRSTTSRSRRARRAGLASSGAPYLLSPTLMHSI